MRRVRPFVPALTADAWALPMFADVCRCEVMQTPQSRNVLGLVELSRMAHSSEDFDAAGARLTQEHQ